MTAPDGRPQGADTPQGDRFIAAAERLAALWLAPVQPNSGVDRVRAAIWSWPDLCKALDALALAAPGGTAAPTDEQVADALREWHDLTANQRATWDRLRPRWSLAAFIGHHLRVALAARTPQPADGYHPNGWCTPARLVLLWLASLDKESMAQARRMVTLDDIIAKAQEALAFSRARTPQPAPSDPQETP